MNNKNRQLDELIVGSRFNKKRPASRPNGSRNSGSNAKVARKEAPTRRTSSSSSSNGSNALNNKESRSNKGPASTCSFCQSTPAAVLVALPSLRKKNKTIPTSFCLLHYYTTSAIRVHAEIGVSVINQQALDEQLPAMQRLFSEAFVQLQQDLSEESARSFAAHQHDPLAILLEFNKQTNKKKQQRAPKPQQQLSKQNAHSEGGFLRDIPLPERLLKTQQQQARAQKEMEARMQRAAAAAEAAATAESHSKDNDMTGRRRAKSSNVWHVNLDKSQVVKKKSTAAIPILLDDIETIPNKKCTSCGNKTVESLSANTSRKNQDMAAKLETWGHKDRDDETFTKYRCTTCGKVWNEEE